MESDWYHVEILHYLNPHLIWVKVCNHSPSGYSLEQIGVYGVLPLDKELDIDSETVVTKPSEVWQTAATMVMKKALFEAKQCRFQPTYIDRRSSIFDTNTHKYGELLIEKADGKHRKLSEYLTKSGFALYNEGAFHQELSLCCISTKLSKNTTDEVMNIINEKLYDNGSELTLKKQTTVYQAGKKLEALTCDNLDRHNRQFQQALKGEDIIKVLDKKFKDLELCKDLEEDSVGRGSSRRRLRQTFDKIDANVEKGNYTLENEREDTEVFKSKDDHEESVKDTQASATERYGAYEDPEQDTVSKGNVTDMPMERLSPAHRNALMMKPDEGANYTRKKNLYRKKKTTNCTVPIHDSLTEKIVAYSPPGVDKMKLVLQVVPRLDTPEEMPKIETDDEVPEDKETKDDMFAEVDSNVNIQITNINILKNIVNKDNEKGEVREEVKNVVAKETNDVDAVKADDTSSETHSLLSKHRLLQKKLRLYHEKKRLEQDSASSVSNTTAKDTLSSDDKREDSDDDVSEIVKKYKEENVISVVKPKIDANVYSVSKTNNVNPFKNVDPNLSVFVDKLVSPVLMVHTKNNVRIEPKSSLSDIPFNENIHNVLKKTMKVERPMTMQSVSWFSILQGYSVMLIGPKACGKTLGYLPSVCRLVSDGDNDIFNSVGPTCIIVCATAKSVSEVEFQCKMLLSAKEIIFSCYAGMDLLNITTSLLNGCNLFICTPCVLVRLLVQTDFGVDLRRLATLVLDDCERLNVVYQNELRVILAKVKEMMKSRVNKEVKVQYVLASRVWCDFMEPLAKKAPNTVICIGAFQECVLYSKTNTTVDFVKPENKNPKALEFLKNIDKRKKTVVVCRKDEEVHELGKILLEHGNTVFACNSTMTVEDLRNLNLAWNDYADPVSGPILVCCDGNLSHMNVTDAHYLLHYSMPELFSMFCKRFSALNDHYPSIFKSGNESVSIKIILEDTNSEQLPKICNFVKRCTNGFPDTLNEICHEILTRKDLVKAADHVPICGNLLALGECPDFWYCKERHTYSEIHDEPKEWMPTDGTITFKILQYQTAVLYSARLLSNIKKSGTQKYSQTYSTLSLKMGMYFSQDANRKLHGIPKVGDICAVSIKENFFVRCQVVHIISRYTKGNPNHILVKLIDEEKLEASRDIHLYHLPKELKEIETYVVQVRLTGVVPKDKDITFSDLAKHQLTKAVDINEDVYMRGKVVLTVGNQIFVDNIYVCQDLSSLNEIVVKNNFKEILEPHSVEFPDHIINMKNSLRLNAGVSTENTDFEAVEEAEEVKPAKNVPTAQWEHLEREDQSLVYFTTAIDPSSFFVRLAKFEDTMRDLGNDIDKYVEEKRDALINVDENDIVLAKFPDDECYERARVDVISGNNAKCFFVDHGDWRAVPLMNLMEIPDEFITRLPFQAIECRLVGVRPVGDNWTDFSTNWLSDRCDSENLRPLFVKYYSSDKANYTGGTKYAVVLTDTNGDENVVYNNQMIDLNLAAPKEDEIHILDSLNFTRAANDTSMQVAKLGDDDHVTPANATNILSKKLIRSVPLVGDGDSDDDKWDINMAEEIFAVLTGCKPPGVPKQTEQKSKRADSSKSKVDDFPKKPEPKPHRADSSITKVDDSPNKTEPKPKGADSSMAKVNDSPKKTNPKPKGADSSIAKVNDSPKKTDPKPELADSPKAKVDVSPKKHEPEPKPADSPIIDADTVSNEAVLSDYEVIAPLNIQELDSDDLSSVESQNTKSDLLKEVSQDRKPKIMWRQNKSTVTLKIMLIGADDYKINILDRAIDFSAHVNDTSYKFNFELYGVINKDKCSHSDKGQYILVKLVKLVQKNWLTLTKKGGLAKWIAYDVDSIDASSDEEEVVRTNMAEILKSYHRDDTDSDDEFCDDASYNYGRRQVS